MRKTSRRIAGFLALAIGMAASLSALAGTARTAWELGGNNGSFPLNGNLLILNGLLYGAASKGGFYQPPATTSVGQTEYGTIFALPMTTPSQPELASSMLIHQFNGADGSNPNASLVADGQGNLYGTTTYGGANNRGTVFRLINPHKTGVEWPLTILHSFTGDDGAFPVTGVTLAPDGSLYGVCSQGGQSGVLGVGTVYKLSPTGGFTLLHVFTGRNNGGTPDAAFPHSNIVLDPEGVAIGTTQLGIGPSSIGGGLFTISPAGQYKYVLDIVPPTAQDQAWGGTVGNIVRDRTGNVYGTAYGEVYKITALSHQVIAFARLQYSDATGIEQSLSGVVADAAGNLYGTTSGQKPYLSEIPRDAGSVFAVNPAGTLTKLVSLSDDNMAPAGGVIPDSSGFLWGTSSTGGTPCGTTPASVTPSGCGTVFQVTP